MYKYHLDLNGLSILFQNHLKNHVSQSMIILYVTLQYFIIFFIINLVVLSIEQFRLRALINVAYFNNRSITICINLSPSTISNINMKFKEILSHVLCGIGNGFKGPIDFYYSILSY